MTDQSFSSSLIYPVWFSRNFIIFPKGKNNLSFQHDWSIRKQDLTLQKSDLLPTLTNNVGIAIAETKHVSHRSISFLRLIVLLCVTMCKLLLTLLLWSLTLMIGSFFLRSHTVARPLGLADAKICWTCLFHAMQLISSGGCKE